MNPPLNQIAIDSLFEHYNKPGSPGCAVAIMHDGKLAFAQGYGLANIELKVPISPGTVFNLGSMAKQFTAFAILLLEKEGCLSLEDDLRRFLPEMHDFGVPITLRHLVHHTSGLRDSFPGLLGLAEWRDADHITNQDVLRLLKNQRELNFRPGDEYLYANSNYVLLAEACARVSGETFGAFCERRLFKPLEMEATTILENIEKLIPDRASGYYARGKSWFNAHLSDSVVGPTNVYSTVEDLARWDENFYTGRIGGEELIAHLHQPGKLNDGRALDYAFGLQVGPSHQIRGWKVVEHGGSHGGYSSHMLRLPELHLSVVVLLNYFTWEMRDATIRVLDHCLEEVPVHTVGSDEEGPPRRWVASISTRADELQSKVGVYFNAQRAAIREIVLEQGRLQFDGLNLIPLEENLFSFEVEPDTHVAFSPPAGDSPAGMKTITPSGEYHYEKVETLSPDEAAMDDYLGRYYSPELDVGWQIMLEAGEIIVRRRKYVDSKLTPLFRDAFQDDWMPIKGYPITFLLVFTRDASGMVDGLHASGAGVRNLRFSRQKPDG